MFISNQSSLKIVKLFSISFLRLLALFSARETSRKITFCNVKAISAFITTDHQLCDRPKIGFYRKKCILPNNLKIVNRVRDFQTRYLDIKALSIEVNPIKSLLFFVSLSPSPPNSDLETCLSFF